MVRKMIDYGGATSMAVWILQIIIGLVLFAIHYGVMTRLTPLIYRPQFKWYSIVIFALLLLTQAWTWFFTWPESFSTILPLTMYASIFAPFFGVLIYRVFRYLTNPDRDLQVKWRNLMLFTYILLLLIFLYFGYFVFDLIFY